MKKSSKKIPKSYLPKYFPGGRTDDIRPSVDNSMYGSPESEGSMMGATQDMGGGTQNIYNQNRAKSNMLGTNQKLTGNQYAQMGQAVAQGGMQAYQTSQTPGLSEYEKNQQYGEAIKSAEQGVVSAINPMYGMIHAGVTAATAPLTAKATQTDEQGNLKNKNFAKADLIGQSFADPMAMIPTMISNKFSMKKYINSVEDNAKGKIAAQKAQEDAYAQQQAAYQQQQNDYINNAIQAGMASYQNQPQGTSIKYPHGGMSMQPNAEVEKQENTLNPDGSTTQFDGPSHEQGGIPTNLEKGTMIFSDKLKHNGKTFAQLNKTNMTHKEDKILDDKKASAMSKLTANLMKQAKNKSSEELFEKQESLKQEKIENYIKRMGGIQKYSNGGINDQTINNNSIVTSSIGQDPRYYTYQGNPVMKPGLRALSKDSGVTTDIGMDNYNNLLNTRSQVQNSKVNVGKQLPKFEYINDPSKGDYNTQFENYKKVNLGYFRNGGQLPKFLTGGRYVDGVWVEDNQPTQGFQADTWQQSSGPVNNVGNTTSNGTMITNEDFNKFKDSSHAASNNQIINQGNKREVQLGIDIQRLAAQEMSGDANTISNKQYNPSVTDPNSNKFDWKGLGSNIAMGLANNAGNIYNLSRYNKPEVEKYERMKATFLDPSAALRDAEAQTRRAEYNVRGASGGNAGTYLSNRVALNAQNTINKARIHTDYQNANAGISNSVGQYNNELARQEVIANAQNRARNRSGKGEAIGSIGSNIANQMMDNKKTNMDQETLQLMMKYYNDPQFKKYLEESGFNKKKTGK